MKRIKCNNVNYRKGYIEVVSGIHEGCVNLEVTNIHPDVDIADSASGYSDMPDEAFVGNTEIELNIEEAEELVRLLQEAVAKLRSA